jgi:hypothetical protein
MEPLQSSDIYAAIAGCKLPLENFELGQGLCLANVYSNVSGDFLVGFRRRVDGYLPGYSRYAAGGHDFECEIELKIPKSYENGDVVRRLDLMMWIVFLLRLNVSPAIYLPFFSDLPLSEGRTREEPQPSETDPYHYWLVEARGHGLFELEDDLPEASLNTLEWIQQNWEHAATLIAGNRVFKECVSSLSNVWKCNSTSEGILVLWGLLERLLMQKDAELRFRVSLIIASFLEPRGQARVDVFKRVKILYDQRSRAAHGTSLSDPEAFEQTYDLAKRVILKIIERGVVPSTEEVERNILDDNLWGDVPV